MLDLGGRRVRAERHTWRQMLVLVSLMVLLPLGALIGSPSSTLAQSDSWAPPRTVFIPETGQTIDGVFLDQWRAAGGAAAYGYPITPELTENGRTVQYYEYARFEYVPDDPDGIVVHLGEIGRELRPITVFRTMPLRSGSAADSQAVGALAREARAWLPLDASAAAEPDTESRVYVPETGHTVQFGFKEFWEATGGSAYLGNPLTEDYEVAGTHYQVFERGKLAWTQRDGVTMLPVGSILAKRYQLDTTGTPTSDFPVYSEDLFVPPPTPEPVGQSGELWIEVNLSAQYMTVWDGSIVLAETYVSTGREGFDTPTGTFYINSKLDSQTMEGVLGGEYYNVPDVPWVMYFTDVGHAIHGTYWHDNFGAPMSHGCVNLPMDFAAWLYGIADVGTRVEIHY